MNTDEGLIRAVGVRGLTAGIINYMVGAGIFVVPAIVAGMVGAAAPIIYVVCAVAMALIVMCFAEAGSRVSLSGGTYGYAEVAFGPYVGFMVAMCLWFGANVLATAAVINIGVDSLAALSPAFGAPMVRGAIIVLTYSVFAWVNIRGVKIGSGVVQTVTAAKLLPLLILVIVGAFAIKAANLTWPGFPATTDIARTSMILIFAFMGVESALTPSGEVKNPARTVPRAIAIALIAITVLYIAIQVVTQGILGPELTADNKAPLADALSRVLGSSGKFLILVGAAISTFGFVAGDMLASPRGLFALGHDGLLPSIVGKVHDRYRTPHVAIVIHAIAAAIVALTGSFASLVALSVLSTLLVYLICCLATIQLQRKNIRTDGAVPFSVPGGPVIPILATGMIIWLMTASTKQEFLATSIQVVVLTLMFLLMRVRRVPLPTAS